MICTYRNVLLFSLVLSFACVLAVNAGAGIVSYWSFDEGAGTLAHDPIGNNNGTLAGATSPDWIPGKLGGALDFDRADSQVVLAGSNNSVTNLSGAKTFSFWTNPIDDGSGYSNGFLGIDNDTSTSRWYIDDNNLNGAIRISGAGTVSGVLSYSAGWQNIVVSDNGSSTKVYANGQLKGSVGTINYSALPTDCVLKMGAARHGGVLGDTAYRHMDGALDDVAVWNEDLSAGEAMALYSLADAADLGYAADKAQQLFALHTAASTHATTFEGLAWTYATGLSTNPAELGKVVKNGDSYLLPLDSAGTGVVGQADLVAHWKLDDASGSVAADSAGVCHGALTGATGEPAWIGGVVGAGALSFDSYDGQFVNVGSNNAVTNLKGDKTLVFWVNPSTGSATTSNGFLGLDKDTNNRWYADDHNEGGDLRTYGSGTSTDSAYDVLSYNAWQQVALVDEGSGIRVYVDGQFEGTAGASYDFSSLADAIFRIGCARHGGVEELRFLEGMMDDVGAWRRSLTDPEIKALHSLALADLDYDQGEVGQLFALHSAGQGSTVVDGRTWVYTTGLTTDLGTVVRQNGVYLLRLDAAGSGLVGVPEPASACLLLIGLFTLLRPRRRTR